MSTYDRVTHLTHYRMNVAITRAKDLLVIIGSAKLLQRDDYWNKFLQFAVRNKLYVSSLLPRISITLTITWQLRWT